MLFSKFCAILERITNTSKKADKVHILEELWISIRNSSSNTTNTTTTTTTTTTTDNDDAAVSGSKDTSVLQQPQLCVHGSSDHHPEVKGAIVAADLVDSALPLSSLSNATTGERYFSFMRLLMPQLDTLRSTYGLKESKIAKMYVELLGIPLTSSDALRFLHWKDPSKNSIETTSFSDVVFVVLGKRGYQRPAGDRRGCTIPEINRELDLLCAAATSDEKKAVLMRLLRRCSSLEHKWLIRIITKEMKLHLMHPSILSAFHPSAMELYNNTNDLSYVCKKCTEASELIVKGDMKHGVFLFQPVKPMLASVVSSAKLTVCLQTESLVVEPKFDGERMMIHMHGDRIQYWTRNAKNYSSMYGPKFNDVLLRGVLRHGGGGGRLIDVSNVILDGEFLLYDSEVGEYKEFGSNRTHAKDGGGLPPVPLSPVDDEQGGGGGSSKASEESSKLWFCYQVFDILFLNGESLLTVPLEKRKSILRTVVQEIPTKIELTPTTPVKSVSDILSQLDIALSSKQEGVMIKVAGSHYVPGERKTKWMKLKPDHIAGLADTLDLVILGGYYGTKYGVRSISHFLLGVWKNESSSTPLSPEARYLTVCKVGSGYSEQELRELQDKLDDKWIPLPHGTVPAWLGGWKPGAGEVPDVYIEPKESIVLEIFGYSFQSTTKFSFGQTLRFPRCHRVRLDKTVADATDLLQLIQIQQQSKTQFSEKIAALSREGPEGGLRMVQAEKRSRKVEERKTKKEEFSYSRTMAFVSPTISVPSKVGVDPLSTFLDGYEVCILFTSPLVCQRQDMEKRILAHGGVVVAHPQPKTSLIVASSADNAKVQNWISHCTKNEENMLQRYHSTSVIRLEWLLECMQQKRVLPLAPRYVIYADRELQRIFDHTLDVYHDSYYDPATVETLRSSIERSRVIREEGNRKRQREEEDETSAREREGRNEAAAATTASLSLCTWSELAVHSVSLKAFREEALAALRNADNGGSAGEASPNASLATSLLERSLGTVVVPARRRGDEKNRVRVKHLANNSDHLESLCSRSVEAAMEPSSTDDGPKREQSHEEIVLRVLETVRKECNPLRNVLPDSWDSRGGEEDNNREENILAPLTALLLSSFDKVSSRVTNAQLLVMLDVMGNGDGMISNDLSRATMVVDESGTVERITQPCVTMAY